MSNYPIFDILDQGEGFSNCKMRFDVCPPKELLDRIIAAVGGAAKDAMRVEVAFDDLLREGNLSEGEWWQRTSKDMVKVPLGPRGALEFQELEIGTGLAHHGLIVGRPGSGKSNLMHVIITSLAVAYPPEELEMYLIDFKKGVEFKSYAEHSLPHAKVIAIESEREFGISVLRGLDKELTRRGELFRGDSGGAKISDYRNKTGEILPRIVLLADEFQEFFTVEDATSREASLLFDRIVRQGRAFGIHLILGTQTLAGSYGLGRSTIDQISIRIALQCSEADSRLVLGDDNPGARFLSRPGEAIYNAENGTVEANKLFQVAMFSEDDKDRYLTAIATRATSRPLRKPIVFEGHMPAKLEISEDLQSLLRVSTKVPNKKGVPAWLGEPIGIKEPNATTARFRRQAGSNLLIVARDEEQGIGVVLSSLVSIAVQQEDHAARFVIADYSTADADWATLSEEFCDAIPHEAKVVRRRQIPSAIEELWKEVEVRQNSSSSPATSIYFTIIGLQRSRELRKDDEDFGSEGPSDILLKVLREGPEVGIHVIAWTDTPAGISRSIGRKGLGEFGLRTAGVLSNEDSQTVFDDSSASKIDRPHRMLLYDEEQPGVLEKFRPFAIPSASWITSVGKILQGDA